MKILKSLLCPLLGLVGVVQTLNAQSTLTPLHNFSAAPRNANSDGANPLGTLILSGSELYGTAIIGGAGGDGTIFGVDVGSGNFTNLHNFTGTSDGDRPSGGLALSGGMLYGTAEEGGAAQNGTVFTLNADGSGFSVLYSFKSSVFNPSTFISTNGDGSDPLCTLAISGGTVYGTANGAGAFGSGTIFALTLTTNGVAFSNLYNFSGTAGSKATNSDGSGPSGTLVLSDGLLYGTTSQGGAAGAGSIFRIGVDGTGFTNLHSFGAIAGDGSNPEGGLTLSDGTLYGTTAFGGNFGNGTIFSIITNGVGYMNLHSFTSFANGMNSDGYQPKSTVTISGSTLYGTASAGGTAGGGTVYSLGTNGGGFVTLYSLTNAITGANPNASVVISSNILYGANSEGGTADDGTLFALTVTAQSPVLAITRVGAAAVVSWPGTATNYSLQMTTNLASKNWSDITSGIFTVGTNFVFTNPGTASTEFFRLHGQ